MIEQLDVNGVRTLFVAQPGPTTAGISFRVGVADETLQTRGITHLLEHLALHPAGITDYHANGMTGGTVTTFHVGGASARVAAFMDTAVAALADLPAERLEAERRIVQTEGQGRGVAGDMGIWRYGAAGYGMSSYPEWAVGSLTIEQLQQWSSSRFTAANACLWIVGETVPEFTFHLPQGDPQPLPDATTIVPEMPAFYSSGRRQVGFDSIVTRSAAARVLAGLVEREMYQRLRVDNALSYVVNVNYDPFSATEAGLTGFADALEEYEDALVGEFLDTLARIEAGCFTLEGLDAVREKAREAYAVPDLDARRLAGAAVDTIFEVPIPPIEQLREELEAVTLDDVAAVASEARASMLLRVPLGTSADWGGFAPAPAFSTESVDGTVHDHLTNESDQLVIGDDGITLRTPGGPVTIRYADTAAVLAWPDGAVRFFARDGMTIQIEPNLLALHEERLHWLYNQVPPEVYIALPARAEDEIPQRPVAPPTPERKPRRRGFRRR